MKQLRLFSLMLLAAVALTAAMASTASAELPKLLPEAVTLKGTSSATTLETLAPNHVVTCKKNVDSATAETEGRLGKFTIDFEECSTTVAGVKITCTGLSEATGIILALGTFHLVYDILGTGTALGVAILFLLSPEVHFECPTGGTLVLVRGSVACLVKPVVTKVKTTEHYSVICEKISAGDPRENYFTDAGVTTKTTLLTSFAGGTFESSSQVGEASLTSTVETEIMG